MIDTYYTEEERRLIIKNTYTMCHNRQIKKAKAKLEKIEDGIDKVEFWFAFLGSTIEAEMDMHAYDTNKLYRAEERIKELEAKLEGAKC